MQLVFWNSWNSKMLAFALTFRNPVIPRDLVATKGIMRDFVATTILLNNQKSSSPLCNGTKIRSNHLLPLLSFHSSTLFLYYFFIFCIFLECFDGKGRKRVFLWFLIEWKTTHLLVSLTHTQARITKGPDFRFFFALREREREKRLPRNLNRYETMNLWNSSWIKFLGGIFFMKETINSIISEFSSISKF